MEHYNITLTTEDRRILNSYCTVATGMAEFWGENCEIIIIIWNGWMPQL